MRSIYRIKRRLNIILFRCGFPPLFLLVVMGCSRCTPQPDPAAPTTTSSTTGDEPTTSEQCAQACNAFRAVGCTQATPGVSYEFDESGEPTESITCEQACETDPAYYLGQECER